MWVDYDGEGAEHTGDAVCDSAVSVNDCAGEAGQPSDADADVSAAEFSDAGVCIFAGGRGSAAVVVDAVAGVLGVSAVWVDWADVQCVVYDDGGCICGIVCAVCGVVYADSPVAGVVSDSVGHLAVRCVFPDAGVREQWAGFCGSVDEWFCHATRAGGVWCDVADDVDGAVLSDDDSGAAVSSGVCESVLIAVANVSASGRIFSEAE